MTVPAANEQRVLRHLSFGNSHRRVMAHAMAPTPNIAASATVITSVVVSRLSQSDRKRIATYGITSIKRNQKSIGFSVGDHRANSHRAQPITYAIAPRLVRNR